MPAVLGIFVGGQGRRFGGRDKSALPSPDGGGSLLSQHVRLGEALGMTAVLVGERGGQAPEAAALPRLTDDPPGIGPLGGLCALLAFAERRPVVALACDMPYVDAELVSRLLSAAPSALVAPRDPATGKWYPLFARYDPSRTHAPIRQAAESGVRSFQTCFRSLPVAELPLSEAEREKLRDWDRPEDLEPADIEPGGA